MKNVFPGFFKLIFLNFYIRRYNGKGLEEKGEKTERKRKMSVVHRWCRAFAVPLSASRSLFLLFSHIQVAYSVDKDGGPLSPVGRLDKRDSARGAELCDATAGCHVIVP